MPALAAHVALGAARGLAPGGVAPTTIDADYQAVLEALAGEWAAEHGAPLSLAMVLADSHTGEILASVGAADAFDERRRGWVDMTRAARSPGSALKPFIYALAFDAGIVHPETLIEDRPVNFGGYRPGNFDHKWHGVVSVREALALSLNVPAVMVLDSVGPARLMALLRHGGAKVKMPSGAQAGLPIALGGLGVTLRDLTGLYAALANGGRAVRLSAVPGKARIGGRILARGAAWQVMDILRSAAPPPDAPPLPIAYKTGTSYGFRDAWSVGFNGRYVLGVWVGRVDGVPVPGILGRLSAAPVLYAAFARLGLPRAPFAPRPAEVPAMSNRQLPAPLRRFVARGALPRVGAGPAEQPPEIVWPQDGARVEIAPPGEGVAQLAVKMTRGRAPFRWLVNGRPARGRTLRRKIWLPVSGAGFQTLTVVDAAGRAGRVRVYVDLMKN
jgi:penicillin-binding protein 1C